MIRRSHVYRRIQVIVLLSAVVALSTLSHSDNLPATETIQVFPANTQDPSAVAAHTSVPPRASIDGHSDDQQSSVPDRLFETGIGLAMPSAGLSFRSVLSERHTLGLVIGNGLQVQLNFTGSNALEGYYLLGAGRDDTIGLVRGGYGYKWQYKNWSIYLEASLNIPVWDRELGGLADIGKIVYLFPVGFGVHYRY